MERRIEDRVEYVCDECSLSFVKHIDNWDDHTATKFSHKCGMCDHVVELDRIYPYWN